jgi:hypothetical protein
VSCLLHFTSQYHGIVVHLEIWHILLSFSCSWALT